MKRLLSLLIAAVGISLATGSPVRAADTLEELLEQTRSARAAEEARDREREQAFLAARDQQARLLAEAEEARRAAEQKSEELSSLYDENETLLDELDARLQERSGNLAELFGVVRQISGDTANGLEQSLITAEFPERVDFLRGLSSKKGVPTAEELEKLWFEILREMTESGRVVRRDAEVIGPGGEPETAEVVRIGPFGAVSDGRFLAYMPTQRQLAIMARQPSESLRRGARELQAADSGVVRTAVDPSRGVILSIYVDRPGMWERVEKGEKIGYVIIAVGLLGSAVAVWQFFYLLVVRVRVRRQLRDLDKLKADNPLGRVLLAFKGDASSIEEDAEIAELRITEAVLRETPRLERFQAFLRLAVAAGPLLGLIGCVIGMIITFQSVTEAGSSDPKLMANGISQAMVATVLGIGIAVPLLFANALLVSLSRYVLQILDEQTTGILAETLERRKNLAA